MGSINRASVASTPDTNVTARANPSTAGNHGNDGEEVAKGTKVLERTATGSDEEIEDDSVDITAASTGTKERSDPTGTAEAKEPTDTTATQSDTLTCTDTRLPTPPHSPQHTHTQQPQHPSTEQPRVHTQHSTEPPLHTTQPTHTPALTLTRPTAPEDTSAPIPQNQVQASGHAKPAEGQKGPPLNRANSTPHRSKDEIQVHTPVPGSPNTYKFRSAGGSPDPLHQSKGKELGLDQQNEFDEKALMRLAAERSLEAQKALVAVVEALMDCIQVRPWRAVVCATRAVLSVMSVAGSAVDLKPFQMQTSKKLWDWLDPSNGLKYEQSVELVNAFLALHTHVHTDMCERSICADLSHSHAHVRSRAASRFSSMWSVSEGLANKNGRVGLRRATLCMLDLINDEDLSTQLEARSWLSCALGTMASLLDPLLEILLHPTTHRRSAGQLTGAQRQVTLIYR
ncbi:hypothetical protein SARC_13341 [Sphaeroforma arctica JP610]|uniref:Uncharacterized protein n=1 Tax=Sphaeroforma arctica JP610 TaxID=667725 RepID=A0A0L0FBH4_9EUKA|nr:hypothetical protein SARC_13341 [Sphaeroforma arctica JP610]KNC74102.1 hypothetical protein SARC_13341 [Sphaeroforma arctica JP610]|eukprot:XP_014148004.1 hypothetical protein SARC_13341 [Sphaeroforma arctica JP610]